MKARSVLPQDQERGHEPQAESSETDTRVRSSKKEILRSFAGKKYSHFPVEVFTAEVPTAALPSLKVGIASMKCSSCVLQFLFFLLKWIRSFCIDVVVSSCVLFSSSKIS